ncbi:UNVERIFIED_CONTAM: hypothetical protein Sangu_3237500 [Sesamum angustifolium]|uniref:DUF4283 domain-containing protein n=1 Tax=Sesamum angustifolium TaxID=2727405 RepID=A0AAW2JGD6_9LAMI
MLSQQSEGYAKMLPNSNSLCPLSHNTHTESSHTTHTEILTTHAEHPDGENKVPEADFLGEDDGKDSPSTREEFDFDAFYELANRVLTGDSDAMASLNSLKDRWEQHFKTSKNPALKSVLGRPSTPFRPRVSLLPRRCVRTGTDSLPDLVTGPVPRRGSQSGLESSATVQNRHNVKLQAEFVDTIAGAFLQSSRKTLHFVPPTRQNGEVIIRPTKEVIDNGSKKWRSTAVGYFLGKRPYFPQVESFVRSNWKGLQHVSVSSSGFFFFRFFRRLDMEDVIEGGPWLFQGQPIVLQPWEQGMSLRRQKHTQIPVWIRLRHLPMEYWTDEGLSTVASGVGTPLYTDSITKDCSRLDFARPPRKDLTPPELKLTEGPRPEPSSGLASVSEQSTVPQLAARWCANSGSAGLTRARILCFITLSALDTELTKEAEATEFMGPNESSPMLGDL